MRTATLWRNAARTLHAATSPLTTFIAATASVKNVSIPSDRWPVDRETAMFECDLKIFV